MKCVMCKNKKHLKKTSKRVRYTQCGLDNVVLYGVDYYVCNQCGEEYFGYGDQEQLHSLIAERLIRKKNILTAKELRFLRSHLGYSTKIFAKLTGYDPASISRFENDKNPASYQYDRLVRSFIALKLPNRNYDLQDAWLNDEGEKIRQIELQQNHGWSVKNAA